ncbi:MAG TPA: P1 family peptidase [bacterium]|nr:P1 family peptidase [bacterium]
MTDVLAARGRKNSLTDVAPICVGHVTLVSGDGPLVPGKGPVRTGVTVIVPGADAYRDKCAAGVHVINGFGKMLGIPQVEELGRLESPIALTSTLSVWHAADGLTDHLIRRHPEIGRTGPTCNPVVGECSDARLNDIQGRHVQPHHVLEAIERASDAPVEEGAVGAGTGMICYGFKGGIGSASRRGPSAVLGRDVTLGGLVLANFGRRRAFRVHGCPVGALLTEDAPHGAVAPTQIADSGRGGSVIVILATDAPLTSRQLTRVARRAAAGLARTGSVYSHHSGDFALAFSTARAYPPYLSDENDLLNPLFEAAADVTEEAVIRALLCAEPMTGRDGHYVDALDSEALRGVWERSRADGGTGGSQLDVETLVGPRVPKRST